MIALLSTLIYRGDVRMEKEFKNGDIVEVINDGGSLRRLGDFVKIGDKGTVVNDYNQNSILVDFGSYSFYVTAMEIELVTDN